MKKVLYFAMMLLLSTAVMTSCDDDDDAGDPPAIVGAEISGDNAVITLTFDKEVYKDKDASMALDATSFEVTLTGGTATPGEYTVEHTAGDVTAKINFTYTGVASGDEVITVAPVSVYSADGAAMEADQEATVTLAELGIIGEWYSSGANVAGLLTAYFNVDSIYAQFNPDQTYVVESYDADGVLTEYLGTYTQTKSDVGNIYTIELNQSAPSAVTSEGIFEVYTDGGDYDMQYEVVQTQPDLGNSAPTPDGGFGSSNGGALGDTNVQKFKILN